MEDAGTPQDKLERLLEDGKISEAEYDQLADAMHRHAPAQSDEEDQAAQRKPLRKDVGRAWVAGVCAGLGRYFNIDPRVPRIITVVSIFLFGPAPAMLYLVLCAAMPWDDPEAARASRADVHPIRFATVVALLLVVVPTLYCAFVVPRLTELLVELGVDLSSNALVGLSFQTMSWYSPRAAALACLLCSAMYHVTCNTRFRRVFERVVIWPSIVWLLFLVAGNLLPLVSMLDNLK